MYFKKFVSQIKLKNNTDSLLIDFKHRIRKLHFEINVRRSKVY